MTIMDPEKSHQESAFVGPATSNESVNNVSNMEALDPRVVRKLRLKVDLIILPTLAIMYTFK